MYQFQAQKREPDDAENALSSDEGISSAIRSAVYRLILNQAVDALKNLANSDKLVDLLFREKYSDEK